jgi:nitronate monooxygenase
MLEEGNIEKGNFAVGLSMGLVKSIPSCRELLDGIMAEAEAIISKRLPGLLC